MSTTTTGGARQSAAQAELSRRSHTPAQRIQHALHKNPWLSPLVLLVLTIVIFSIVNPRFLQANSLSLLVQQTAVVAALALGQTLIILTAGIDLSAGAIGVLSMMIMASLAAKNGLPGPLALVIGIAFGLLAGYINGLLVTRLNLPPFIVTLGTFGMTFGFGDLIDGGSYLPAPVPTALSDHFGSGKILGLYAPIYVAVFFLIVAHVVLHHTRFGRYTAAIGSNAEGTRRTGIAVDRHIIKVYGLAGFLAGVAAVLDLAIFTNTTSISHQTDNLGAIGAVVIGGTSLFGGVGTVLGSAVGAFIPTVLQNGLVIEAVQPFWQEVVVGAAIILAVYVDQVRRRRASG